MECVRVQKQLRPRFVFVILYNSDINLEHC